MFNRGKVIGGLDLDFEYLGADSSAANQNSYTFSSVDIGDVHLDRMVVVCFNVHTSAVEDQGGTVTIGGNAATVVGTTYAFGSSQIAYLKVPTGTSADIVVTRANTGNTPSQCNIAVYRFNTKNNSPLDSGETQQGTGSTNTVSNIECANRGVVFFSARDTNNTGSLAWNGTDTATVDVNALTESVRRLFGHVLITEDSTVRDAVATWGSSTSSTLAVASFALD